MGNETIKKGWNLYPAIIRELAIPQRDIQQAQPKDYAKVHNALDLGQTCCLALKYSIASFGFQRLVQLTIYSTIEVVFIFQVNLRSTQQRYKLSIN